MSASLERPEVVYVAGELTTGSVVDGVFNAFIYEANVARAEAVSLELLQLGLVPICPHTQSRHFFGTLPEPVFIRAGLVALRRCDAVVLVNGYDSLCSSGTRREVRDALDHSMPVYRTPECIGLGRPCSIEALVLNMGLREMEAS